MNVETSGFIQQCGPLIPCLKSGEKTYNLTPEELSELLNKAFADGYAYAKGIYDIPEVNNSEWDAVKETAYGTH